MRKHKWDGYFKIGDKFGKWSVLDGVPKYLTARKEAQILCKCECGTEQNVWALHLKRGNSLSCGCSNHDRSGKNHVQFTGTGYISGQLMNSLLRRAKSRNHLVLVSAKELNDLLIKQNFKCALTNLPIDIKSKTASLDRIDSSENYIIDNVQWVHKSVNIMKNGYSNEYFIKMCHLISKMHDEPSDAVLDSEIFQFGLNTQFKTTNTSGNVI